MKKKSDFCKEKEFPSDIRNKNYGKRMVMVMYDENRKFTKLIKFMAENYYSNNSELNEAVSAFEDAIETSGNGEASFGVAGEDWERVEISQPPYTYPDAQFYASYDNGFQAPFLVCL